MFFSLKPDGSPDPSSLHGSCPTTKGDKWSATKWIHVAEFGCAVRGGTLLVSLVMVLFVLYSLLKIATGSGWARPSNLMCCAQLTLAAGQRSYQCIGYYVCMKLNVHQIVNCASFLPYLAYQYLASCTLHV